MSFALPAVAPVLPPVVGMKAAGSGPLCMQFVPRAAAPATANLAAMVFGSTAPALAAAHTPALQMAAPALGQADAVLELWQTDQPVRTGRQGLLHYAQTGDLLFGAICLPDTDDGPAPHSPPRLQQAAEQAYLAVFAALESLGYPHLLRVWNYLSGITDPSPGAGGMERYLQFNIGRQDAFRAKGQPFLANAPAACALGTQSGGLQVYFLAAKVPPLAIENPRQVSAYFYPAQYGPRTPSFSRAALARLPGQRWLFISGTASIVGHQSLHLGDVAAQTAETLRNIQALLDQANVAEGRPVWTLADLHCKVYVRLAADLAAVQAVLDAQLPPATVRIYLQAEVCRAELLVEIDATGCLPD